MPYLVTCQPVPEDDTSGPGDAAAPLLAEGQGRKLVIAAERVELDQLLARRKISERVAVISPTMDALQGASGETPCRYKGADLFTGVPVLRRMGPGSG